MDDHTEYLDVLEWPLEIYSAESKGIFTLLEQPSHQAGGKILVLFGDLLDSIIACGLAKEFAGPNAWALQCETLVKQAESIDLEQWFEYQLAHESWLSPRLANEFSEEENWWVRNNWREMMPAKIAEYGEPTGENYDPLEEVLYFYETLNYSIVPVEKAWMIPCYLNFRDCNDLTDGVHMAALFKRWEEKYGAELCMVDGNGNLGFRVARPPQTMEEAMVLAREHHIFCAYCIHDSNRGVNSMREMLHFLINNHSWHFWFD